MENSYYVPKAITLICELPIFDVMQTILYILFKQWTYRINYPIDSYLIYLTYEAPLPSWGSKVKYSLPNMKEFELTDFNYNIELLANYFHAPYLRISHFNLTLYWFLCQVGTTLFISSEVTKLVNAGEVFRALIYPFVYDDPYIPVLSPNMIKSIEAPFPCHLGILVRLKFHWICRITNQILILIASLCLEQIKLLS